MSPRTDGAAGHFLLLVKKQHSGDPWAPLCTNSIFNTLGSEKEKSAGPPTSFRDRLKGGYSLPSISLSDPHSARKKHNRFCFS